MYKLVASKNVDPLKKLIEGIVPENVFLEKETGILFPDHW